MGYSVYRKSRSTHSYCFRWLSWVTTWSMTCTAGNPSPSCPACRRCPQWCHHDRASLPSPVSCDCSHRNWGSCSDCSFCYIAYWPNCRSTRTWETFSRVHILLRTAAFCTNGKSHSCDSRLPAFYWKYYGRSYGQTSETALQLCTPESDNFGTGLSNTG